MTLLPFYIFFGLAPSIIWLLFYLRKDHHPEPNRMVIKVFIWGMMFAVIAAVIEIAISELLNTTFGFEKSEDYPFLIFILYNFIGIALVEEFTKYLAVKKTALKSPEFDEPVDAQLYMIISALGFAALENILILLPVKESFPFGQVFKNTLTTSGLRFISSTFLHALISGTLGYFLAMSIYYKKKRWVLIITGLAITSFLHGVYNLSIIKMFEAENLSLIIIPAIIITGLAIFVLYGFKKLNKIKSVCQIK